MQHAKREYYVVRKCWNADGSLRAVLNHTRHAQTRYQAKKLLAKFHRLMSPAWLAMHNPRMSQQVFVGAWGGAYRTSARGRLAQWGNRDRCRAGRI